MLVLEASAQERKGFWFDFGVGLGSAGVSADGVNASREGAGIVALRLGWALNPQLLAGFELRTAAMDLDGDVSGSFFASNVQGILVYYPRVSSGLFVNGGVGGSFLDVSFEDRGTTLTGNISKGFGVSAGIGYDFYLGRGFSLTPAAGFWYGQTGDVTFRGATVFTGWSHNVVDATISIKFN
jgi:hypothetical protein